MSKQTSLAISGRMIGALRLVTLIKALELEIQGFDQRNVTARDSNHMPYGTFLLRLQKAHDSVAEDAGFQKWDEDLEDYGQSWDSDASGQIVASLDKFAENEGLSI